MNDEKLREIAERATPGPWRSVDYEHTAYIYGADDTIVASDPDDNDKAYLLAFDPPTVLSLLDRALAAEGERERLAFSYDLTKQRETEMSIAGAGWQSRALAAEARVLGLVEALEKIEAWRRECLAYDADTGQPPRAFGDEDFLWIENIARDLLSLAHGGVEVKD